MSPRRRTPFWLCLAGLLGPGFLALVAVPSPSRAEEAAVKQKIVEVERQIAELQKQLADLRRLDGAPAPAPSPPKFEGTLPESWVKRLGWRCIGPATMGGRIVALAVYEADPSTYWIGTASGGLLKTTNNGVTFEHQFDREATVAIGDVAVAPSDPKIVWVGTGEHNPRNSVSYGDGVYKSTDGGKKWTNVGLKQSFQIGRIAIHPKNPDVVYVGALGRLYGPSEERGVYKTTDGGKNWAKVLDVNDRTGIIDLQMNPKDPETLLAAAWERQRDEFDSHPGDEPMKDGYDGYDPIKKWGPGSGIYKTVDGGKSWRKVTQGLPATELGRIGIDYYRKDPNVVFAIVDGAKIGMGIPPNPVFMGVQGEDDKAGAKLTRVTEDGPAAKAGLQDGDVVTTVEKKPVKKYEDLTNEITARKPGDKLNLTVLRGMESKELTVTLGTRPREGGGRGGQGGREVPTRFVVARALGLLLEETNDGLRVERVIPELPGAAAGIQEADVIRQVDKKKVEGIDEVAEKLQGRGEGDKLSLTVARGKETKEVTLTLAAQTGRGGGGRGGRQGGVYLGVVGDDTKDGVKLTEVVVGGPAQKAGLKVGDLIAALDKKPLTEQSQFAELTRGRRPGDQVTLTVVRGKAKTDVVVSLAERPARGAASTRPWGAVYGGQRENVQDQQGPESYQYGGVYRSADGGETWARVNSLNPRPMYFSQVRVDPSDDKYVYVLGVSMYRSRDGGKRFTPDGANRVHPDQHALWIDPRDGRHMLVGTDGGTYVTHDRMNHWDFLNHAAIGQFYHVCLDNRHPYRVYGGMQDNGSWAGPSRSLSGGILNEDWLVVGSGDGFVCGVDRDDSDVVYYESQDGNLVRRNLRTNESAGLRPQPPSSGNRGAGGGRPLGRQPGYRFNWNTPFILSHHNSRIYYSAGDYVFRSVNRGDGQKAISPEITRTKRGSGTALSESPLNPDVLWAGTDDGWLWVTRDGGKEWANVTANLHKAGVPGPRWVATIEASRANLGRAYVVLDAHRSDDDNPYVLVTEDFGQTWKSLRANLPWGSTRVLREDPQNPNVLYLGTEFAVWASINRGESWTKINNNLPTVAVHEIAIHPTAGEIVAATHGRSIWILDVSAVRQFKPSTLDEKAFLFKPQPAVRYRSEPQRGSPYGTGSRVYAGQNPPRGAQIYYALKKKPEKISLKVLDYAGRTVRELRVPSEPGLHQVAWDMTRPSARAPAAGAGRRGFGFVEGVETGTYRVMLAVDGKELSQPLKVESDPTMPNVIITEEEERKKKFDSNYDD